MTRMVSGAIGKRRLFLAAAVAGLAGAALFLGGSSLMAAAGVALALGGLVIGEGVIGRAQSVRVAQCETGLEALSGSVGALWTNVQSVWDSQNSDNRRLINLESLIATQTELLKRHQIPVATSADTSTDMVALHEKLRTIMDAVTDIEQRIAHMERRRLATSDLRPSGSVERIADELRSRLDLVVDMTTALQISVDEVRVTAQRKAVVAKLETLRADHSTGADHSAGTA